MEQMVWLILLIVFIVVEAATMGLTVIWFAGGALVAAIASLLGAPIGVQLPLFIIVSMLLLFFTRPVAVKYFNKDRTKTNASSLIGCKAIVTTEIDNIKGQGKATVGGQEWTARSSVGDKIISVGEVVAITAIEGVKLMVAPETSGEKKVLTSVQANKESAVNTQ